MAEIMRMAHALGEQRNAAEVRSALVPLPSKAPADPTLDLVAASLAGGMIAAGGREATAEEAVQVWRGVREALAREQWEM